MSTAMIDYVSLYKIPLLLAVADLPVERKSWRPLLKGDLDSEGFLPNSTSSNRMSSIEGVALVTTGV